MPAAAAGHAARSSRIRSFRLLRWAMGASAPIGTFDLYAVEGGTAAMCVRAVGRGYVDTFNALKEK